MGFRIAIRHDHSRYDHLKSPEIGDPLSLFYASERENIRWQAHRTQPVNDPLGFHTDLLLNHDGLSPLLLPTFTTQHEQTDVADNAHTHSSPRHRPGFSRSFSVLADASFQSPTFTDNGLAASPALPVLSPYASERSKRSIRSPKRVGLRAPTLLHSRSTWLTLYFVFNLGLTLYNKLVLVRFPFPYTLTALHALCGSIGGLVLRRNRTYVPARLSLRHRCVLAAFSVLYAVNIAISNASLQMVTVPFHQIVRAATPIFTTALSVLLFGTRFSKLKIITLIPVMVGVALATYGDYYFTMWGLLLTLLGTFLAALKTIYTNVLQSTPANPSSNGSPFPLLQAMLPVPPRLSLHPLDLLTRTSPLACILCVVYAFVSGELSSVHQSLAEDGAWKQIIILVGNGAIAFGLNVVSLSANKRVGPLNMTVAANVKQAMTILCAVALFQLTITPTNAVGICVTLAGGAWYAWVEYVAKMKQKREQNRRLLTGGAAYAG